MTESSLFEDIVEFPDDLARREFENLVGLDEHKHRLVSEAVLLMDPSQLEEWSKRLHGELLPIVDRFRDRPPLFILAGDVGTGKTALARSFGDAVCRRVKAKVRLYALSLSTRGSGTVGEMTQLITKAFQQVREQVQKARTDQGKARHAAILMIDEADSLAQSRAESQMHHEDRNGVNALIRGIDAIAAERLPIMVVMCTNRDEAIDPAVQRRASAILRFLRPDDAQRLRILTSALAGCGATGPEMAALVAATGSMHGRSYGYTYSDLTQRLVPALVLDAFPDNPITAKRAIEIAEKTAPTPPFQSSGSKPA